MSGLIRGLPGQAPYGTAVQLVEAPPFASVDIDSCLSVLGQWVGGGCVGCGWRRSSVNADLSCGQRVRVPWAYVLIYEQRVGFYQKSLRDEAQECEHLSFMAL